MLIPAASISLRVAGILHPGAAGRVLASFERVCDLVTDDGAVAALVWGGVDDGPLNVVLARKPGVALPAGTRFAVECRGKTSFPRTFPDDRVSLEAPIVLALALPGIPVGTLRGAAPLQVDLSSAVPWDPRPDWETLRARREQIAAGAAVIRGILKTGATRRSGTGLIGQSPRQGIGDLSAVMRAGQAFAEADHAGDWHTLATMIPALCGLGPGLTPAGDDWLAGWLLGARLAPDLTGLRNLSGLVTQIAATCTTALSRAFLECAAAGEADAGWHALLGALANASAHERISALAETILAHGDTSGVAMLSGFVAAKWTHPTRRGVP